MRTTARLTVPARCDCDVPTCACETEVEVAGYVVARPNGDIEDITDVVVLEPAAWSFLDLSHTERDRAIDLLSDRYHRSLEPHEDAAEVAS